MSNFFAGIHRAADALNTARYGLEVSGQNIANANTPGYTRQTSRQAAVGGAVGVPTLHSGILDQGGVRSLGAERLTDLVLARRVRTEHAKGANVDTHAARIADLENIFHEPSDTGLSEQLDTFWNAWGDVANDPGAKVPRQMLIQSGQAIVTTLRTMNAALDSVATAANNSLTAEVTKANTAASELADLNRKIAIGDATDANVNALLDQRDVLLDTLAKTVGGVATIHGNGTASVTVGGAPGVELVSVGPDQDGNPGGPPFTSQSLTATVTQTSPGVSVQVAVGTVPATATPVTLTQSTAAAEIHALSVTVPNYRQRLDTVAQNLADTTTGIQQAGYDLGGVQGTAMFDDGSGGATVTAATISVAAGFTYDNVAAAATQGTDPVTGDPVGNVDGSNALEAAKAGTAADGPDAAYSSLIGQLGLDGASALQQQSTQAVITKSVDTLHATSAGVSFDEEVSNILTYQKAYQASARVLSTLDSMLDTLINRTGA